MQAMLMRLATIAGKAAISWIMSYATEEVFRELFDYLLDKGVKSTKTTMDDELASKLREKRDGAAK